MAKDKQSKEHFKKLARVYAHIKKREGTEAIEAAEKLIQADPENPGGYFMLGLYAFTSADFGRAIELFAAAHERDPDCREYADCLAILYTVTGKLTDGLYFAKLSTALESDPNIRHFIPAQLSNYFEAFDRIKPTRHYIQALISFHAGKIEDAIEKCHTELKQNEKHDLCFTLLGKCQLTTGEYEKAMNAFHAAIHLNPDKAENLSLLGATLCRLGRFREAFTCHGEALAREPESMDWATQALFDANFLDDDADSTRAGLGEELEKRFAAQQKHDLGLDPDRQRIQRKRIRIGYISNALHDTETARFISALLKNHDRGRFEIFCYQQSVIEDTVNVEMKNLADSWRNIYDVEDPVMEMIIKGDEIDVLVDLCGHTPDNRAGLLASCPAPVQIAWLEPPYGIGIKGFDFVLSDVVTHETDEAALGKNQKIVKAENGLFSVEPLSLFPDVGDLPAATFGRLTFGGQCDLARLTSDTALMWARVLNAAKGSKLLLGDVGAISNAVKNQVIELFAHFGMADRISFLDGEPEDYFKVGLYQKIDVLLDTYPVSGRYNICKALWMGIPVFTVRGPRRVSLIGASILQSASMHQWIFESGEKMAETAADLAGDLEGLATIRRELRDKVTKSALFMPRSLALSLETAYLEALEAARAAGDEKTAKGNGKKKTARKAARKPARKKTAKKKTAAG